MGAELLQPVRHIREMLSELGLWFGSLFLEVGNLLVVKPRQECLSIWLSATISLVHQLFALLVVRLSLLDVCVCLVPLVVARSVNDGSYGCEDVTFLVEGDGVAFEALGFLGLFGLFDLFGVDFADFFGAQPLL